MNRKKSTSRNHWVTIPLRFTEMGGTVEFLDHGAVRLSERVFPAGHSIDYAFADFTATRSGDATSPLKIKARHGGAYYFKYGGSDWFKLIEEEAPVQSLRESLRTEIALSGPVIGPIYWFVVLLGTYVALPLLMLVPYVGIAYMFHESFADHSHPDVATFYRWFSIGTFLFISGIYICVIRHWQVARRSGRRTME
jgi:hypothetical protein